MIWLYNTLCIYIYIYMSSVGSVHRVPQLPCRRHPAPSASRPWISADEIPGWGYRCLWKKKLFLQEPFTCNPAAEAAIQSLIWCFWSQSSHVSLSPEEWVFFSQTPVVSGSDVTVATPVTRTSIGVSTLFVYMMELYSEAVCSKHALWPSRKDARHLCRWFFGREDEQGPGQGP